MQIFFETSINHYPKPYLIKRILVIAAVLGFLYGCKKNPDPASTVDCSGAAKSFAADVSPVIQASCALSGCHATGSNNGPGPLLSYTQISNAKSNIRSEVSSGEMPKNGSLTASQKAAIICWIDNGAPNN
jgi:hypothetical protein